MANSVDYYFRLMQKEKNNQPTISSLLTNYDGTTLINTEQELLTQLQSENKVAVWKLWMYITAVQNNFISQNMDLFKTEIEAIKDATPVYNKQWWSERALEFQTGYTLEIADDNSIGYAVEDLNARIIGNCAVSDFNGKVVLKIRGKNTDLLTTSQYNEFTSYVSKFKPVGDRVIINNYTADDLKLSYTIYYNSLSEATIQASVEDAINNYIANLGFDSELNITDLTNILQELDGVVDPVFVSGEGKQGAAAYSSFTNYYDTIAGYARIDPAFPLSTSINYVIKNN